MDIPGPLCMIPNHDDHGIMTSNYEVLIFLEVEDDGRLVPKLMNEVQDQGKRRPRGVFKGCPSSSKMTKFIHMSKCIQDVQVHEDRVLVHLGLRVLLS